MQHSTSRVTLGLVAMVALASLLAGCGGGGSGAPSVDSPFQGTWSGWGSGGDSGPISITVAQNGTFTGTAGGGTISGTVTDAGVVSGSGTVDGYRVTMSGTLHQNGSGSGTWASSYPDNGTWTMTRE